MSGSFLDRYQTTLEQAEKGGLQFQEALGARSIEELRFLAADRIHAYSRNCRPDCVRISPIVDGYFMPDQPSEIFARGEQRDVPVMIGFTRDEGFSAIGSAKTLDDYRNVLYQAYGDSAVELMQRYPASDDAEAWRAARDVARDSTLGLSMRAWADLQYKHGRQPAYAYMFARVQPYTDGISFADHDPATVGSYHTADVPYWLQTLDSLNLFRETRTYTPYDRQLADLMSDTIIAFAETGKPSTELVDWPAYSPEDDQLVEFGLTTERLLRTIPWPNSDSLDFFRQNQAKPVDVALLPGRRARD